MAAATATNDRLWQTIRDEAQRATAADPVFGKSFADAVLVHDDFGAALADLIGRRLGGDASGELPTRSPRIGRGVYIGAGASILGDLSIGDFAKIGAGTVVTSDVPGGCTAVGNPARLTNCPEPASAV